MIVNVGTVIGDRYEIIEKIGTGGMADVYRARDRRLNRFVAVKILKNEYSEDTKFVTKFHQEAQAIACLTHPNVVSVYDVGEENGMHYFVMEFVDGITLKKYIEKKGKLSVRESVGIALQIANGLEAAHSNHIIHRDIKPQNILISKDGTAKVSDFGIAKAASSNTITASTMGSVHYISPEQARGGFSDEKSDIYSLGVTMYEMLSGTLPFTGESAVSIALAHIQEDAAPLAAIDATIPKGLSNIVAKCMQKKTELRYLTAADLIADLKMFLQDPTGEYGVIRPLYENADTIFIPSDTVSKAAGASPKTTESEPDEDEEEDESEVDPKLEKALIIGSIVVAAIIGIILIFMVGKLIGLWGGSSSDDGSIEASPSPSYQVEESALPGSTTLPSASAEAETTEIPDIAGEDKDTAISKLEEAGFSYKFTEQSSDTVSSGKVIGTNPAIGSSVESGSKIEVYISSGPSKVSLMSVMGYTYEDAKSLLEAKGYVVRQGSSVYSDSVEKGLVAYTDPKGGAKVLPGATITLYMSKGKQDTDVQVPDLLGDTKAQARAKLKQYGLKLGTVTSNYSSNVEKGCVCVQSKLAGSKVAKGTAVDITISLGEEPTYKYYSNPVTIDNPFEYESDPAATFKFVLNQDGKKTTIKTAKLNYSDFPYTLTDVEGSSTSQGDVLVYMNGKLLDSWNITFRKVAE